LGNEGVNFYEQKEQHSLFPLLHTIHWVQICPLLIKLLLLFWLWLFLLVFGPRKVWQLATTTVRVGNWPNLVVAIILGATEARDWKRVEGLIVEHFKV
jgi:hypothetical protein